MNKQTGLQFIYFLNQKQSWLLEIFFGNLQWLQSFVHLILLVSCHHHHSHQDQTADMLASITETTSVLFFFTRLLLPWSDLLYHIEDYVTVGVSSCAAGKNERKNDNHPPHTNTEFWVSYCYFMSPSKPVQLPWRSWEANPNWHSPSHHQHYLPVGPTISLSIAHPENMQLRCPIKISILLWAWNKRDLTQGVVFH